jgi:Ca2+-binding RTX toxin-like protein
MLLARVGLSRLVGQALDGHPLAENRACSRNQTGDRRMKLEIGNVTNAQLTSWLGAFRGTTQTTSATSSEVVYRTSLSGSAFFTAEEEIHRGSAGLTSDTLTQLVLNAIQFSGQRTTMLQASEFSLQQSRLSAGGPGTPAYDIGFAAGMVLGGSAMPASFVSSYLGGNDTLIGNAAANTLHAGSGNDRISGGPGADTIDGGLGVDASVYREGARADYLVTRLSNGTVFVATRDGTTDRNVGIENLEFVDGTVAVASFAYLPGFTAVSNQAEQPVFRFYNTRDKAFFYTTSTAERDMIIRESTDASYTPANGQWPYFYQGATYEQAHSSPGSTAVYRFYNTKTGHHFFTTSPAERDVVLRESTDPSFGQPGLWPFAYEGEAFRAYADPNHRDATPVYRFYSPSLDRHFFTGSVEEAAQVRLTGQWNDEGVGYWGEVAG